VQRVVVEGGLAVIPRARTQRAVSCGRAVWVSRLPVGQAELTVPEVLDTTGSPVPAVRTVLVRARAEKVGQLSGGGDRRVLDGRGDLSVESGIEEAPAVVPRSPVRASLAEGHRVPTRGAARRLRRLGLSEAPRPESFWVTDTRGPLVAGETERAHAWAETVATRATRTGRRDPDLISEGLHGKQLQKSLIKEDTGRTTVGEGSLVERQGEAEKESRAPCVY
jgi:hypothetical protein